MTDLKQVAQQHAAVTRRYFLKLASAGTAGVGVAALATEPARASDPDSAHAALVKVVAELNYLTPEEEFTIYGRGNPKPHTLSPEKRRAVGLTRDTWNLEVVADPDSNSQVEHPLSIAAGTALNFDGLMDLAREHAVRFLHVMSCTNGRRPCGMGLWEGVPLRHVIWMTRPKANVRRVFYHGFHNDDPEQMFQGSLPIGRVLEDPPGVQPVILCYKLNDRWLSPKQGAPVRMMVPDAYGNKSTKWLQRVTLTNSFQANDTYAEKNNDTVSHLKTCARFIHMPREAKAGQRTPITGVAQVGMSGLAKVQYWVCPAGTGLPSDDPYFATADWQDAEMLPAPTDWGGNLPGGKLPPVPSQVDPTTGKPHSWPLRDTIVHWAALVDTLPVGDYHVRCRTIDDNGIAQPMPRPFAKSGHNAIQRLPLRIVV